MRKICSQLIIKAAEEHSGSHSGDVIVNSDFTCRSCVYIIGFEQVKVW